MFESVIATLNSHVWNLPYDLPLIAFAFIFFFWALIENFITPLSILSRVVENITEGGRLKAKQGYTWSF